jgi:hypothetical protein
MILPIAGQTFSRVAFDYALSVYTDGGAEIRIEGSFDMRSGDSLPATLNPSDMAAEAPLILRNLQQPIRLANVEESGQLTLKIGEELLLCIKPDMDYEAWEYVDAEERRVVCLPGGGIATWGEKASE